eukprot:3877348-Amphidinium_carterae.1
MVHSIGDPMPPNSRRNKWGKSEQPTKPNTVCQTRLSNSHLLINVEKVEDVQLLSCCAREEGNDTLHTMLVMRLDA